MQDYEELQRTIEDTMVSKGAERYAEELARGLSGTGPGKSLLRKALRPVAEALELKRSTPVRGVKNAGLKHIEGIDAYILADVTLRRILDCASKEETLIKTCKAIASGIEWHVRDAALNTASTSIWKKTQDRLKKTANPAFRRASIDGTVAGMRKYAEVEAKDELLSLLDSVRGTGWGIDEQIAVGSLMVDLFATSTKMVTTREVRSAANRSKVVVTLTGGTQEWLERQHGIQSILRPVHLPMVVPPTDWSGLQTGGYRDNAKAGVKFVKGHNKATDLESIDLSDVYDSVNLIQRTPWRVNAKVYATMRGIWETGSGRASVPPKHHEDGARPLKKMNPKFETMSHEERRTFPEWNAFTQQRKHAYTYNADLMAECNAFVSLMSVAEEFSAYPAFYHPHKLDWRQRAYPISVFLSPQGDQFNKGLLEFARGSRMGDNENSAAWLCIHGANTFGVDKVSFEDRIAWVEEHHAEIMAIDENASDFWLQADKQFPFLAFCYEYAAWVRDGDEHVTHLPVALDGSNSGLQHLSCMLRDPVGAHITSVSPSESPQDVYQMVADQVELDLVDFDDPLALVWCSKVSRKICKQPTMTYTYSATQQGMRSQIEKVLVDLDKVAQSEGRLGYLTFEDATLTNEKAAGFLAPIVRAAIKSRMSKAAEAMDFLQDCARVYSKTQQPLRWTTPLGLPVLQRYPATSKGRKKVFIDGSKHELKIERDDYSKTNKRKAAAGISPNFTHSMDSTHLLWTTLYVSDEHGVQDFAMIHDSFGTHATGCDAMAHSIRETMIVLYSEDRLAEFRRSLIDSLGEDDADLIADMPEVPTYGSFDVSTVRDSDYFFA